MTTSDDPLTATSVSHSAAGKFRAEWWAALGISLATALLIVTPFFALGTASGHDFEFHASSWLDAAAQWKEGILLPRWTEWANHGFGEPRFIFYPPLSWMLGAALGSIIPWSAVPVVFIVLVQTMAGLSAFALARNVTSRAGALFGAACYAANPYALLVVYMRSDFAEQLAAAFFPLLLLLAIRVSGNSFDPAEMERASAVPLQRPSPGLRDAALFAAVFAVVWLSNAPAGVMASYATALMFGWVALREKSLWPGLRGVAGLGLGFGLTAFYLLPAAYEQKWVSIDQALSSGLQPVQNFLFTATNDPEHTLFNWIASTVAILLMVATGIAALLSRRGATILAFRGSLGVGEDDPREQLFRTVLLMASAATLLMLRPTDIFWRLLPKLRFVQFPWRWMALLAVCYAFFLAGAIARARYKWILIVVVAGVSASTAVVLVRQTWWDTEDIPTLQEGIADGSGFDGTDEYDPQGDDRYNLPARAPEIARLNAEDSGATAPNADVQVEKWTAGEKRLRVSSPQAIRLALRLLDYPAWQVEVNGNRLSPQHVEGSAQMVVPLRVGTSEIRVRFAATTDRKVGAGISLASLLVGVPLLLRGRRRRPETHATRA